MSALLVVCWMVSACADADPPDTEVRPELAEAYQTCFDLVERQTGRDLSPDELSQAGASTESRLARDRIVAAINRAADRYRATDTLELIRLPVLFVREPGDSGYAEDALYDLECDVDADALVPAGDEANRSM